MSTKPLLLLLTILFGSFVSPAGAEGDRVRDFNLDPRRIYEIPVSIARVTTIAFPSPIDAIDGALVTIDGKTPGLFQIAHTKGTPYLSVRALAKGVTTNLNVRWHDATYVFELREGPEPIYSAILAERPKGNMGSNVTPARLLGALDKAKAFSLLQEQAPQAVEGVEHRDLAAAPLSSDCGDYEIKLLEAFRFPDQDTLVFSLAVSNRTEDSILHVPEAMQVRAGNLVFTPSISDLPAEIGPKAEVPGFVAITGSPDGTRNDLSLKNDFLFSLSRFDPLPDDQQQEPKAVATPHQSK